MSIIIWSLSGIELSTLIALEKERCDYVFDGISFIATIAINKNNDNWSTDNPILCQKSRIYILIKYLTQKKRGCVFIRGCVSIRANTVVVTTIWSLWHPNYTHQYTAATCKILNPPMIKLLFWPPRCAAIKQPAIHYFISW